MVNSATSSSLSSTIGSGIVISGPGPIDTSNPVKPLNDGKGIKQQAKIGDISPDLPPVSPKQSEKVTEPDHSLSGTGKATGPTISHGLKTGPSMMSKIADLDIPLEKIVSAPEKNETLPEKLQTVLHTLTSGEGTTVVFFEQAMDLVRLLHTDPAEDADPNKVIGELIKGLTTEQRKGLYDALTDPKFNKIRMELIGMQDNWSWTDKITPVNKIYAETVHKMIGDLTSGINSLYTGLHAVLSGDEKCGIPLQEIENLTNLFNPRKFLSQEDSIGQRIPVILKMLHEPSTMVDKNFIKSLIATLEKPIQNDLQVLKAAISAPETSDKFATVFKQTYANISSHYKCTPEQLIGKLTTELQLFGKSTAELETLRSAFASFKTSSHGDKELEQALNSILRNVYDTMFNKLMNAKPIDNESIKTLVKTMPEMFSDDYSGQVALATWIKQESIHFHSLPEAVMTDILTSLPPLARIALSTPPELASRADMQASVNKKHDENYTDSYSAKYQQTYSDLFSAETLSIMANDASKLAIHLPTYGRWDNFLRGLKNIFIRMFSAVTGNVAHTLREDDLIARTKEYGAKHLHSMATMLDKKLWTKESMADVIQKMLTDESKLSPENCQQYANLIVDTLYEQYRQYSQTSEGKTLLKAENEGQIVPYSGPALDKISATLNLTHLIATGIMDEEDLPRALFDFMKYCPPAEIKTQLKQVLDKCSSEQKKRLKTMLEKPEVRAKFERAIAQCKIFPTDPEERSEYVSSQNINGLNGVKYRLCSDEIGQHYTDRIAYINTMYASMAELLKIPQTPLQQDLKPVGTLPDEMSVMQLVMPKKREQIKSLIGFLVGKDSLDEEAMAAINAVGSNTKSLIAMTSFIAQEFKDNPSELLPANTAKNLNKLVTMLSTEYDKLMRQPGGAVAVSLPVCYLQEALTRLLGEMGALETEE